MTHTRGHRRSRYAWSIMVVLAVLIAGSTILGATRVEAAQEHDWSITCPPKPTPPRRQLPPRISPDILAHLPEAVLADGAPMVSDGGPAGPDPATLLEHGQLCNLYNHSAGRVLEYQERTFGINLGFDEPQRVPLNIRFERTAGAGPIFFDEPVAIHVSGGGYLIYQERTWGINLGWSATPVYEWRIRGGQGVVIFAGLHANTQAVSLFNTDKNVAVVYGKRTVGPDLRWFKDTQTSTPPLAQTADVQLGFRHNTYSQTVSCTDWRVVWTLTPVHLTGTTGTATTVTVDRTYQTVPAGIEHQCDFLAAASGLRAGTWRVEVSVALWYARCDVMITGTANPVHFRDNVNGCVNGVGWP